jgi:hypothetical protein
MDEVKALNWISVLIEGKMGLVSKRLYQATLSSDYVQKVLCAFYDFVILGSLPLG